MRFISTIILVLSFQSLFAQIGERVYVAGEVIVPQDGEASQIEVINQNTNKGTVTNEYGQFGITVKEGDRLRFEAIQYQNFTVIIDDNIIKKKKLTIKINDEINTLDEVIVRPYDLEGNIEVDVRKVKTEFYEAPESEAVINEYEGNQPYVGSQTLTENVTTEQRFIRNGLNIANIFREILSSREVKEDHKLPQNVDVMVRKMYKDSFFKENLDIEESEINNFIFFVEDKGLTKSMLEKGNELDLIEFLIKKSESFKSQN
ncbi:carboxypeptidase-like regulatory domain-containing protein [Psychroflexus tropicus]|uniref:carboxypeptidase-like regulatory domain-containing protein n=1 Tax=Psychroflexus tropicus TaxID=197345 RepID=UPI000360C2CF|nr:carboxypeptidase-like regulatory domain-containing protein [Psychroflexus tropicus]